MVITEGAEKLVCDTAQFIDIPNEGETRDACPVRLEPKQEKQ